MDEMIKLPAVGSFPGYKLGRSLFLTWATMLNEHADIWNTTWAGLISGDYKTEDYFRAVAQSLKSSSSALEQSFRSIERRGSPPWSPVKFDAKQVAEVKVAQTIDRYDALSCTFLNVSGADAPLVSVGHAGPYAIAIAFDKSVQPPPGQYLGVVSCQRYREPLAIIVVSVPKAKNAPHAAGLRIVSGGRSKPAKKKGAKRKAAKRTASATSPNPKRARRRKA